ncbi:hypothetical protein HK098_000675 [Nowakowskiella sp. JEL0407]|nr:hypothetical protein HK098_000675 [Nowakowskiella sp. JEL0407]
MEEESFVVSEVSTTPPSTPPALAENQDSESVPVEISSKQVTRKRKRSTDSVTPLSSPKSVSASPCRTPSPVRSSPFNSPMSTEACTTPRRIRGVNLTPTFLRIREESLNLKAPSKRLNLSLSPMSLRAAEMWRGRSPIKSDLPDCPFSDGPRTRYDRRTTQEEVYFSPTRTYTNTVSAANLKAQKLFDALPIPKPNFKNITNDKKDQDDNQSPQRKNIPQTPPTPRVKRVKQFIEIE